MSEATRETRHTAFSAAFQMGEEGRRFFVWLAGEDSPAARRAAVLSLYLRWRRDPAYVWAVLDDLAGEVGLPPIWRRGRVLRFLGDLSITIYINHPQDEDVIRRTSALWRRVLRRRLRLHQLLFLLRGPILRHIGAVVSARTLRTALAAEFQDVDAFFGQDASDRERFLRVVPFVDPGKTLDDGVLDDVVGLLDSGILLHRVLGALVIGVHAVPDPDAARGFVDALWPRLTPRGRMWATLAYAIPLPGTPPAWIEQLESATERLANDHRSTFFGEDDPFLARFDIALLPLGLAYGKRGGGMPLFDTLLERGLRDDPALGARMVRGLAAVGVYFPGPVLESLRLCRARLDEPAIADALVDALASMRALHFDLVDVFIGQSGIPDEIRSRISRHESSRLVERCFHLVGYYNNAIHEGLHYPIMRQALLIHALESLGQARTPADFTRAHTPNLLRLLEETDFDLMRWTARDAPA